MDFGTPDFILDALRRRLDHPVLGYTAEPADYRPAIVDWIRSHHGWEVRPEWLTYIPGIVKGIGMAVNVFAAEGERVIVQPPVYPPFRAVPEGNGREVVCNPLRELPDGGYAMDFDQLEAVADERCRLLILSNPHNPGGIVWDRATLGRLAAFCHRHGITVISDEIHCDLALWDNRAVQDLQYRRQRQLLCHRARCVAARALLLVGRGQRVRFRADARADRHRRGVPRG